MHILILTPGFPANENDSTCLPYLQDYLTAFKQNYPKVKISVIAFQYPFTSTSYEWNGINVYPCNGKNKKLFFKFFIWIKAWSIFKKIHSTNKVDIIHSLWLTECAFFAAKILKKYKLPHICTLMGQDVLASNRYITRIKYDEIQLVALTPFQSGKFHETSGNKVNQIIPWGVNNKDFKINNNQKRFIDILGVGNLGKLKNYSLFIDVVQALVKENPSIKAVIIGKGDEYKILLKKTKELGLSENIEFKGFLSREEVLDYMQKSRILLHTSKYESFGHVFVEAIHSGMYVVSMKTGAYRPHPKWHAVDNAVEIKNLLEILIKKTDFLPVHLFPIEDTVKKYYALYKNTIS